MVNFQLFVVGDSVLLFGFNLVDLVGGVVNKVSKDCNWISSSCGELHFNQPVLNSMAKD